MEIALQCAICKGAVVFYVGESLTLTLLKPCSCEYKDVEPLWDSFLKDGATFDDRREYAVEDFMRVYGLTKNAATRLFQMFRDYEKGES